MAMPQGEKKKNQIIHKGTKIRLVPQISRAE